MRLKAKLILSVRKLEEEIKEKRFKSDESTEFQDELKGLIRTFMESFEQAQIREKCCIDLIRILRDDLLKRVEKELKRVEKEYGRMAELVNEPTLAGDERQKLIKDHWNVLVDYSHLASLIGSVCLFAIEEDNKYFLKELALKLKKRNSISAKARGDDEGEVNEDGKVNEDGDSADIENLNLTGVWEMQEITNDTIRLVNKRNIDLYRDWMGVSGE